MHDCGVWQQACDMVLAGFGADSMEKLVSIAGSTDVDGSAVNCVYLLPDNAWSPRHKRYGDDTTASYRVPGASPESDTWKMLKIQTVVKVKYGQDSWYVADLGEDSSLFIHTDIAHWSLRIAAVETSALGMVGETAGQASSAEKVRSFSLLLLLNTTTRQTLFPACRLALNRQQTMQRL